MKCPKCNYENQDPQAKFCNQCATDLKDQKKYIGVSREKGKYRVILWVMEDFDCESDIREKAEASTWGEHREEFGGYYFILEESFITRETHPYVCKKCRKFVADSTDGHCTSCGAEDWVERSDETERKNWVERADED